MIKNLSILLLLMVTSLVQGHNHDPEVVNIGSISAFSSIVGKVSIIAMNAAVEDVNSDANILGGRKLVLSMHDSNFSGFLGLMGALEFMERDTVAIIGPQTSGMAHSLSHLANELHVPMLSFTSLDPTLSPLQYPYFIQTAPNDLFQMMAIADMVSYFGYRQVTAIFSDDDPMRNSISVLRDQLTKRRCRITYRAVLFPDTKGTRDQVKNELLKVTQMESRVIILHTYSKTGRLVFDVAQSLGMMGKGYVWIATTWLSTVLDSTVITPMVTNSIQGAITLRPHTPNSERKTAFSSRWRKLSNGSIGLNPYGLYAYDTVWIIANAVKKFLDNNGTISFSKNPRVSGAGGGLFNLDELSTFNGGKQLLSNILQSNMTGLTGPIGFNRDRSVIHPSYDIINVVGNMAKPIGYWSNYSGLSVLPPERLYDKPANRSISNQQLHNVVWPGKSMDKPRGWVFPKNGKELRIGIPNRVSYNDFILLDKSTGQVQGYCVDVFFAALKRLPYAVPYEFILIGDGRKNPSYSQFVNMVTSNEIDAAIGDITIITNRTKILDFTQPYIESGLVVLTPIRKLHSAGWSFLRPFTPMLWGVTATFFLIVGAVVWILEHRINDEFRGRPKKQFATILWFSFSTMFFSHRENTMTTLGRIVLFIWLFVVLIINESYTASLTSILTVQQLASSINGIESLITSRDTIGFQTGSFAENYLKEELNIAKSRLVQLGSSEEYADALKRGIVAAVVDEKPYVDLFLSNHCGFRIVGKEFTKSGWGFAFPQDSPLAVDLSTAILALSESGELQRLNDKWLNKKACSPQSSQPDSEQFQLKSFWGLFLICGIACFFALVIHFCLMVRQFSRHYPKEERYESSSDGSSRSAHIQKFMAFVDEKEEISNNRLKRKRMETLSRINSRREVSRR